METCRICLGDFEPGERKHTTSCKHTFHQACFDELAKTYKTGTLRCPICNKTLGIPHFDKDLIGQEIKEYMEDWGELNCASLVEQIKLTYGSKFSIDENEVMTECNKQMKKSRSKSKSRSK
jgi:hypothetical protein